MKKLKTSTLIRQGLKHLWDGRDQADAEYSKEEYLCHAIARGVRGGMHDWHRYPSTKPNAENRLNQVRDMIEERLYPYNNLHAWLRHSANVPVADLTEPNLQRHRWKWAAKMVIEFEAKGD